jgi:hypothetical protein
MKSRQTQIGLHGFVALMLICCVACAAQESGTPPNTVSTAAQAAQMKTNIDPPHVLKLRGVLRDHNGKRLAGVEGVLFAVYEQQEGGAPLWQEVQNVEVDNQGRFAVLVDPITNGGIRPELFGPEKGIWLGKQVLLPGEVEQPRIRLVRAPNGLLVERGGGSVTPANSGNQPVAAPPVQSSEKASDSTRDESVRPPRSRLRLHRQRLTP